MKVVLILDFPSQTLCLVNFLFWSYCPNVLSQQDNQHDTLEFNTCKEIEESC